LIIYNSKKTLFGGLFFLFFGTPLQVSEWMKKPSNRREKL